MLNIQDTALVMVDLQEKLINVMYNKASLVKNCSILVQAANVLNIPIVNCRQYPKALGDTIAFLKQYLGDEYYDKFTFDSTGSQEFTDKLASLNKKNILLAGIESHICVYQTAKSLIQSGYNVALICDAVSSRSQENKHIAIDAMAQKGVELYSTEMALFELLKTSKHPSFKEISKLVK